MRAPTPNKSAWFLATAATATLLLCIPAPEAPGKTKSFRAKVTPRALIFKPKRIAPERVRRARLRLKRGGDSTRKPVSRRKVRRALDNRRKLRVSRPGSVSGARLLVTVRGQARGCKVPHPSMRGHARPEGCWRPYSDSSPFNRRVPADAPVVSNSQQIVNRWVGFGDLNSPRFTTGAADTGYDYDHPIYYSKPTDPLYTVQCTEWVGVCEAHGAKIRIPSQARPAGGSDGHLTVIDPLSGWEYDFWQVLSKPSGGGTLRVSHGGKTMIDGDGLAAGATASDFGLAAGLIRPEELAAGEINHALFMVVKCTNDDSVAPAGSNVGRPCSSIGESNTNAPRMGEHFVLDMTDSEINALPTAEWRKAILRAMAHYGLYVGDTGGGMLKIQSGSSWTSFGVADPWTRLGDELGLPSYVDQGKKMHRFDLRSTIDWQSRMKVVDPCVSQGTC